MKLKIKPAHFEALKKAVETVLEKNPEAVERYETGQFIRADRVKDLNRRFRADVARVAINSSEELSYNLLYEYMNDDNIHSAMKRLVPVLTRRYSYQ